MSADWAGWIVLHAMLVTLIAAACIAAVVVTLHTAARWLLRRWWGRP